MDELREAGGTSRRALLGLGLTGLLAGPLAACDDSGSSSGPAPRRGATGTPPTPDGRLVDAARTEVALRLAEVLRATRAHPDLATGALRGLTRLHHQQLHRLGDAEEAVRIRPLPKGWRHDQTKAADAVRAREREGAQDLASAATRAEAGALAGLIAQFAAGIDMQLAATAATPGSLDVEPEMPGAVPTVQVEAMQRTLADEHAALYLYGVLGAHTSASATPALYAAVDAAYAAHRARRDRLTALLEDAGEDPVAAEPGYRIPAPLRTDQEVASEGLRLEHGSAARYLWLVENSTADVRAFGVAALRNTVVRELSFRGSPEIFPGAI